jgi:hypothetical protein
MIRTITLTTPTECLNYKNIIEKLIKEGHQILPYVPYPNGIQISYIVKNGEENNYNLIRPYLSNSDIVQSNNNNLIITKLGNGSLAFTS